MFLKDLAIEETYPADLEYGHREIGDRSEQDEAMKENKNSRICAYFPDGQHRTLPGDVRAICWCGRSLI